VEINELYKAADIEKVMHDPKASKLVINKDKIIQSYLADGIEAKAKEIKDGVSLDLKILPGQKIEQPIHLCFGITEETAIQNILIDAAIMEDSVVQIFAHCVFPVAKNIVHKMKANIRVKKGATYSYLEKHIHSLEGGVKVIPKTKVILEENARFKTEFELIKGRVGSIDIDIETTCKKNSVMEMIARINGTENDRIRIKETGYLIGEGARGVLTSRVALRDKAKAEIYNKLVADAPYARGHVDCQEIVQDNAIASAIPIVEVRNAKAHVTHEASIGSVDSKQLETLMSRGLKEEDAVELIISGLLS
jgi:uncharacterized protein